MAEETEFRKAGFWLRFTAIAIDTVIVLLSSYIVVFSARLLGWYLPFEMLAVGLATVCSALMIGTKGQTLGKSLCGLSVQKKDGTRADNWTGFLREFAAKPIIGIGIPAGLIALTAPVLGPLAIVSTLILLIAYVIHFFVSKRTLYDILVGTIVQQKCSKKKQGVIAAAFVLSLISAAFIWQALDWLGYYRLYSSMAPMSNAQTPYDDREPLRLVDISSLAQTGDSLFVQWLDSQAKSPIDYVVSAASEHQVVVIGETHYISDEISLLVNAVPDLYKAGVRCLAMEACIREDNEDIARLVTAPEYDRDLALRIARDQPWHLWGDEEYWDVLYAVWQLNRSLPASEKKMRVVGIDSDWDGPSFALGFSGGDDAVKGPVWEKLRIIRALASLPTLMLRDELMAKEVERQIIQLGDRTVVWCGAMHSFVNYKQPYGRGRMAYMLHQEFGDRIFQILLHSRLASPRFLERIMARRGNAPAGFDLAGSPFEFLRDSTHYLFAQRQTAALGDIASGYLFLAPWSALKGCRWHEGYITRQMFAENKPYYEAKAGRSFATAEEADAFFKVKTEFNR